MIYYVKYKLSILLCAACLVVAIACSKDDKEPKGSFVTTVKLTLHERGTTTVTSFTWKNLEGAVDTEPTSVDPVSLKRNTDYGLTIQVLDESQSPAFDISKTEIKPNPDNYLFFFLTEGIVANYSYEDRDENNESVPLGLDGKLAVKGVGTGSLRVVLRRDPSQKNASNQLTDEIGGHTDINLIFPVTIK